MARTLEKKDCPVCGAPMMLKDGRRGPFWGCTKYPGCSGTITAKKANLGEVTVEKREQSQCHLTAAFDFVDKCGGDVYLAQEWLDMVKRLLSSTEGDAQ